jgi:hypothetical protein
MVKVLMDWVHGKVGLLSITRSSLVVSGNIIAHPVSLNYGSLGIQGRLTFLGGYAYDERVYRGTHCERSPREYGREVLSDASG